MKSALLVVELVIGVVAGILAWALHGASGAERGAILFAVVPLVGLAVLGTALAGTRRDGSITASGGAVRLLLYCAVAGAGLQIARFSPFDAATFFLVLQVMLAAGALGLLLRRSSGPAPAGLRVADLVLGTAVVLLVGGEVGVRLFAAVSPGPLFAQRDLWPEDRVASFRFQPGTIVDGTAANEHGFLGPPIRRTRGVRTVAVVGGRALGGGLPYQLGATAIAARASDGTTFGSLALGGLSTPEYRHLVETRALPIGPDAIVVVLELGDDLVELERNEGPWRPLALWLDRENVLTALTLGRVVDEMGERRRLGEVIARPTPSIVSTREEIAREFPWTEDPAIEPARMSDVRLRHMTERALVAHVGADAMRRVERATADLAAMADQCANDGVVFGVAVLPARYQVDRELWTAIRGDLRDIDRDAPIDALRQRMAARSIPFLDLTPTLRASERPSDGSPHVFHRGDVRLNAHGNRLCGEALAAFTAQLLKRVEPR